MATGFQFRQRVAFDAERAAEILRAVPALPGVFALRGEDAAAEPYLTRAADLRRRIARLLAPPETGADGKRVESRRLNLRERVRWVEWTVTGSEFESLLVLYEAAQAAFGQVEARRRLRLHTPYCVRLTLEHRHPRVYTTNRISRRNLERTYGPFGSRAGAERYLDGVLNLFRLRRCYEELEVHPEHPGCAYGEMKKCMAPCNASCSAEEYGAEAQAVEQFLATHGESLLAAIAGERERASDEMEFERAAAAHERYAKVKAVAALADELVRPVPKLRAVIVQAAAEQAGDPAEQAGDSAGQRPDAQEAAVFLLRGGCLYGPERMSTLGVRAVKEQTSVGSSLFAQPLMLQAVPLQAVPLQAVPLQAVPLGEAAVSAAESPEVRAEQVLKRLESRARGNPGASTLVSDGREARAAGASGAVPRAGEVGLLSDHLSLLRRWYYRPEKQRAGEIFLPNADGSWPLRRILRGAARMALGEPKVMAETDRDGVPAAKTKILHEGREGVERVVAVRPRARRARGAGEQ